MAYMLLFLKAKWRSMVKSYQKSKRDGMGIWDTDRITVKVIEDARVLLMDVPMHR